MSCSHRIPDMSLRCTTGEGSENQVSVISCQFSEIVDYPLTTDN